MSGTRKLPWRRSWREALNNPKIVSLTDRQHRAWTNCVLIADDDGRLPGIRDIAVHLRMTSQDAETLIVDLVEAGLIDAATDAAGRRAYVMHDWTTWQPKHETSTARVRKHRASKRHDETQMKRSSAVVAASTKIEECERKQDLVHEKRDETVSQRDETLLDSESESETEKCSNPQTPVPGASDDHASGASEVRAEPVPKPSPIDRLKRVHETPTPAMAMVDGRIELSQRTREFWLGADCFAGDAAALDLALIQAAGQVQVHSRAHTLEVQVSRSLARIAADRRDRDRRYREAAARNAATPTTGSRSDPRKPAWAVQQDERRAQVRAAIAAMEG